MKFNEKLILIMKYLRINNIELAKESNLNPTIISKYKCGRRIPTQDSNTLNNLINGICLIIKKKNLTKEINSLLNFKKQNNMALSLMDWFCEDKLSIRLAKNNNNLIGKNLTTIIKLLNMTNVEIAKYLNKDYSLISKYRNNTATLLRTDITADKMCNYIIEFAYKNDSLNLLTSLFEIKKDVNKDILKANLIEFLFNNKKVLSPIENFLENLSTFKINNNMSLYNTNSFISNENIKNIYIGTNEFRIAVKRFLSTIAVHNESTTLNLYSDENMNWMIKNKEFFNTWKNLMFAVLMKKNKIKIIHNINRNLIEMFNAIEGWLPLYMTGLIKPYYCKKPLNSRFNNTIFLADNIACISSHSIRGCESVAIYNYYENKKILKYYEQQYISLIENCKPLVKIFIGNDISKRLKDTTEYRREQNKSFDNIEILSKKDVSTLIVKTDTPSIMFEFEHHLMIDAFESYLDFIK